jgi:unsaturated rhamnogalacturonyl hydrolase
VNRISIQIVRVIATSLLVGVSACGSGTADEGYFDQCEPEVSPAECYAKRRDPESAQVKMAGDIALRYISNHPAEEELWDWRSGVLMYGLAELYRVTGDKSLHDYYQAWMDYRIEEGYQIVWSDSCPPAITAISLLHEGPSDSYQQVVDDVLHYLDAKVCEFDSSVSCTADADCLEPAGGGQCIDVAPRTDEGGISHNGNLGKTSIWVDSLFMFGMVLNRWGEFADPSRLDMESEQIQIFAEVLQDESGFMRHAQDWPRYDESVYWARGNSWVVASLSDYLRIRVEREEKDLEVERPFRKHVEAIVGVQDVETGLWQTVMSHPDEAENYLETSGSALFAYGIARAYRYGVLGDEELAVAQKALEGVQQMIRIDDDGPVVTGVSLATDPWSLEEYLSVPVADDVNYGVGAVILALIETSGLPDPERD